MSVKSTSNCIMNELNYNMSNVTFFFLQIMVNNYFFQSDIITCFRRKSLPLSGFTTAQLTEHYTSCIKLSAENVSNLQTDKPYMIPRKSDFIVHIAA